MKKLTLKRETLLELNPGQLRAAHGGTLTGTREWLRLTRTVGGATFLCQTGVCDTGGTVGSFTDT